MATAAYARVRTQSKYEESNIDEFVEKTVSLAANVTFFAAPAAAEAALARNVLLVGTAAQLADEAALAASVPFYDAAVKAAVAECGEGKTFGVSVPAADGGLRRVTVGVVPAKASRHNCPTRPDVISALVGEALRDGKEVKALDVFVRAAEELCVAAAVARAAQHSFSAKAGHAENGKGYAAEAPAVRVFFASAALATPAAELEAVATSVQLCARLGDAPPNLLDTTTFPEIAARYAAGLPNVTVQIIAGEELREQGYGGIYSVGKGAEFPAALVALVYTPPAGVAVKGKVALTGKGMIYDCGGLAIKTPATNMVNMKTDMLGAGAVFAAFVAAVRTGLPLQLSAVLGCADNAIGPRAYRNDDILRMKCGKTVECNNTDAEGRIVCCDLGFHASVLLPFAPDVIINAATLTGAQGIATGQKHAALYTGSDEWERRLLSAGRVTGDTLFPVVYAPEYHGPEFASKVADMRNLMANTANAGVSCGGYFIECGLAPEYVARGGAFAHIDLAFPSSSGGYATGFGVALLFQALRDLASE